MNHHNKLRKAFRLSHIGMYPKTAEGILSAIPESALRRLSAKEIAELMDAMWRNAEPSQPANSLLVDEARAMMNQTYH